MSQRIEKLQKLAREVLGEAIGLLKDPRIGFVTVTAVRISNDISHARVFVTILGEDEERERSLAGLRSATPHLRRTLGQEMHTRQVPELQFVIDDVADRVNRVEELLHQIHEREEGDG